MLCVTKTVTTQANIMSSLHYTVSYCVLCTYYVANSLILNKVFSTNLLTQCSGNTGLVQLLLMMETNLASV